VSESAPTWLTAKRLRAHGLILAICLWSVYLWNITAPGLRDRAGNLKGTDFLHFYTLGSLAVEHDGSDLYNLRAQSELAARRVPAAKGIDYLPLYPPQVSLFFAPFARLAYAWALAAWLAVSASIYFVCCYAVWRACPNLRDQKVSVQVLALAFPAFWHLIAWGQSSSLALACFTAAFLALRAKREFVAGLAFGCLIFKPQLALGTAIAFLFAWRWRAIVGAILSSSIELLAGAFYYGFNPLRDWIHALLLAPRELRLLEPKLYQTHCLRTFWALLIPWMSASFALYVVSALVVCVLLISCWRRSLSLPLRFSTLLLASVLLSPHLTVYDLVILAPAFLLLSDSIVDKPWGGSSHLDVLLYAAFVLPLLGPLARWTHLQLTVPVMAAILYEIWSFARKPDSVPVPGRITA
jgi:alpha-1,2-mannosyltransferase